MDNTIEVYIKRVDLLEEQLKKKICELRLERECNREMMRYIHYLVVFSGGKVEIDLQKLASQKGQIMCRVRKKDNMVVLRAAEEKRQGCEDQETVQMNIYDFPQYLPDQE